MDPLGLAYLAGFFDGEGCIGVYPSNTKKNHYLRVQLTQNASSVSRELLEKVRAEWGGSIHEQVTRTGKTKLGYQVTSVPATRLLEALVPYLRCKRDQAVIALAWQRQRSPRVRDARGRLQSRPLGEQRFDAKVARLIQALKHQDIDQVMEDQRDLVEIEHTLTQVLNYKGL